MNGKPWVVALTLLASFGGSTRPARAEQWIDSEKSLTWEEMLGCELIVVAKHESHQNGNLTLGVQQVLKGNINPEQRLTVKLEHLYSIETGPVGWETWTKKDQPPDNIPKLRYKGQIINPGDLVPLAILDDARQPTIYFFPKAAKPALHRPGQVQDLQFRQGWEQALAGKQIDLLFRLTQFVDHDVARDALEELGRTREGAILDQLFDWIINPPPRATFGFFFDVIMPLARLGDKDGDVYDRARKLFKSEALGRNEYRFYSLAAVMAAVDARRAALELPPIIADKNRPAKMRKASLSGFARTDTKDAARLALDCLSDVELGETAYGAIRELLDPNDYRLPKVRKPVDREWLLGELRKTVADERIPEKLRKNLTAEYGKLLRQAEPLDLEDLRKRLLEEDFNQRYISASSTRLREMLDQARQVCDPRIIPILVEIIDKVPDVSKHQGADYFQKTVTHYALICPRAIRKELEVRGFPGRVAATRSHERAWELQRAFQAANILPPDRTPAHDERQRWHDLAKQVRAGVADERQLVTLLEQYVAKWELHSIAYDGANALLEAGTPAARTAFFAYLQKTKQKEFSPWSQEPYLNSTFPTLLNHLYPEDAEVYFSQVRELLASNQLWKRKGGVEALSNTFYHDFDFDPEALEFDRSKRLAEMEPWFERLKGKTRVQADVVLLSRNGVVLEGDPSEAWLPALFGGATDGDQCSYSALRLLGVVLGDDRFLHFHFPPSQLARALRAYLQDAGKSIELPPR